MVKHIERRAFAFLLALVMIFSLVPVHAFAASTVNVLDGKVTVSDADSVTDDGVVTLSQEPTYDSCGGTYSSASKTVTITNKTTNKAVVSFTYTKVSNVEGDPTAKGATINGSTVTATLAAGGTFTFTFATRAAQGAAVIKLSDFSIVEEKILKATFMVAANGSYTVNGTAVTAETTVDVKSTDAIALAATPASGYAFAGWYNVTTGKALSFKQSASINLSANATITPLFISNADAVWAIEEARFTTLDEALTAAAGAPGSVIRPLKDVTLTKSYTIPAGITLLVPYNDAGTCLTEMTTNYTSPTDAGPAAPKVYRTLTLADGVTLTVNGQLSVSALHYPATGSKAWGGRVDGNYGLLKLNGSSKVIVGSGASMYAFGYVLGTGSVEALSGATIYENMQMVEFIGGSNLLSGLSKHQENKFFLFSQYYVQNIESALKINSGAALKTFATMNMSNETKAMPITFIGEGGMFALDSGSYAVKKYDAATDRLSIDAYGNISVSSINMTMTGVPLLGSVTISSSDFYLPVNANITVNINSGTAMIYQSLTLLPGARINVAKGAQVYVPQGTQINLYDQAEWGNYVFPGVKIQPLTYIGSTGKASTRTINGDAILDINGVLGNAGAIYTSASGAQIISSKGNGIYIHMADAPTAAVQIAGRLNGGTADSDWDKKTFNPAWLLNNDGTFVETINSKTNSGYIFNPLTGKWEANATVALYPNGATGEVVKFEVPAAAIAANQGNSAALPDAATAGFNMTGGEFLGWNTKPDGTGTSYAAGTTLTVTGSINLYAQWKITGHTITFLNEDGSVFKEITVNEGATPDPEGYPTKAADLQYTYTFAGWDLMVNGEFDGVADTVAAATAPATYKAIFNKTVNTYDVVFYDEDGTTVLYTAENVPYGTVPAYEGTVPSKAGNAQFTYTFAGWSATKGGAAAAVPAVDGTNLAYYAVYTSETNKYTVTWTNENGDLIDSDEVAYGTVPTAPVAPSKASDAANHYAFAGWDANNDGKVDEIVAVTGAVTYKAVFTSEAHKYDVTYTWTGTTECVAKGICSCNHTVEAKATITSEITKPAACGVTGETTYTAKFAESWAAEQKKTVADIPALEHDWSDPSYTWTGTTACTATRVCGHDASHVENATATITSEITKPATCALAGETTYTATFTEDWAKTQVRTIADIPATGEHVYVPGEYIWAEDGSSCTVEGACGCGDKKTATATITSEITKPATCGAKGETTYTATFTEDWAKTQVRTIADIPATGEHVYVPGEYIWAEDGSSCTVEGVCSCNDKKTATATITSEITKPATCEGVGETTYTATFAEDWAEEQKLTLANIPATDHAWGKPSYVDNGDGTHTAYYVCGNDASHTKSETNPHDYDDTTHDCDCGAVETFSVTVNTYYCTATYEETATYGVDFVVTVEYDQYYEPGYVYVWAGNDEITDFTVSEDGTTITIPGEAITGNLSIRIMSNQMYADIILYGNGGAFYPSIPGAGYTDKVSCIGAMGKDFALSSLLEQESWVSRSGYTLVGWNTEADGSGTSYNLATDSVFLSMEKFVLYAQWQCKHLYTEAVDNGDGTHDIVCTNTECHEVVTDNEPHDYTHDAANHMCICGDVEQFTVSIYWNGDLWIDGEAYDYGTEVTFGTLTNPTGYTFVGYAESENGGVVVAPGAAYTVTKDVTLYAVFEVNTYTVTWIVDGKTYTTTQATYGQAIALPATEPTKTGYTFIGWKDVPETMPADENLTIEAEFTANVYQVTWFANGGSFIAGGVTLNRVGSEVAYDSVIAFTGFNLPTREGYTFTGWNTKADGSGDPLTAETVMNTTDNLTAYYAQWEANTYYVTFTINGEAYGEPVAFKYGEAVIAPEYTVPEGYTFSGWNVPAIMPAENITLDATLTVNSYTLTIYVLANDDVVELTVPYGANLFEVLEQAIADGKIPALGTKFRYQDEFFNGEHVTYKYSYFYMGDWSDLTETDTMPARDFDLDQDFGRIGWYYTDQDEDGVVDGVEFYDFRNGFLDGWQYIEEDYDDVEGGAWYYFTHQIIDSVGYYYRAEGVTRVPYPTEEINGTTYAPNAEDVAYYENKGETFIDKETGLFVFDEDGKFQFSQTGRDGDRWIEKGYIPWHIGMVKIDNKYYYFVGDEANGGNILATKVAGITENESGNYDIYVSRANHSSLDRQFNPGYYTFYNYGPMGTMYGLCNYGKFDRDLGDFPKLRYYGTLGADRNRLMMGLGLTKIYDDYIYVCTNGDVIKRAYYWVPANDYGIPEGMYWFDNLGHLVMPEPEVLKDGIYFENGAWYYYEAGHKGYDKGLIFTDKFWFNEEGETIWGEGATIYVRSNGQLATGAYYVTNLSNYDGYLDVNAGDKLLFNEMGMLMSAKNGIVAENGSLYYYVNNKLAYAAGLIVIDGNYYYVTSSGEVVNNRTYWVTNVNDTGVLAKSYVFDANGVMQNPQFAAKNGIVEEDGVLYYYINNSKAYAAGIVKLEENTFIYVRSNGQLAIGQYWATNTNGYLEAGMYDFGADGILVIE